MKIRSLFFLVILFFCIPTIFSQQPISRNYTLKDGLPSNETYFVIKDKKGIIWFATDAGICSFNGYKFRVFSERNGLPESVIIRLYAASDGKIWFSTLSFKIGYIENGKVHNIKNFSAKFKGDDEYLLPFIYSFYVDDNRSLWLGTLQAGRIYKLPYPYKKQILINKNSNVLLTVRDKKNIEHCIFASHFSSKRFVTEVFRKKLIKKEVIQTYSKTKVKLFTSGIHIFIIKNKKDEVIISDDSALTLIKNNKSRVLRKFKNRIIFIGFDNENRLWIGLHKAGIVCISNVNKPENSFHFNFSNLSISSYVQDNEGGYWFSTLEKGVIYLSSMNIQSYGSKENVLGKKITSIAVISKDSIGVQEENGIFSLITSNNVKTIPTNQMTVFYSKKHPSKLFFAGHNMCEYDLTNNQFKAIGVTNGISYFTKFFRTDSKGSLMTIYPKVLFTYNKQHLFQPLCKTEERINDVYFDIKTKKYWLATNGGLISFRRGESFFCWKNKIKKLRNRIDKIEVDRNGNLWLATRGNGLFIFDKKNKLVEIIEENGLASNFCRTLYIDSCNTIWVGTNLGLSMVNPKTKKVSNFSYLNNSIEGEINDIKRVGEHLWVATGEGLYKCLISELERVKLKTPIYITNVSSQFRNSIKRGEPLKYNENFLKFKFLGLSYYNEGNLEYLFKLQPIDQKWRVTKDLSTEYFNLPPGNYKFVTKVASSGENINNPEAVFKFSIHPPFWKTWWFIFIIITLTISLVVLFFNYKIHQVRNKEKEKGKIQLLLAKMEAKALRAQMSPHFIFNALNSIQNFILKNENRSAHEYLSKFARLMRNILDGSNAEFITLEKEIETLRLYIQLEKMRASDRFEFEFIVDEKLHISNIFIPSMILQPFIENAILHGLFPKSEPNGILKITFISEDKQIRCIVEDNGIGRNKAKEINEKKQQYHKSMGMSVTHDRIEKLKKINKLNAAYTIHDLFDEQGNSIGTKVVLVLPIKENNS